MCGIAAIVGYSSQTGARSDLSKIMGIISHRGESRFQNESRTDMRVALGGNRLPFTSRDDETQPVESPSGRYRLVLNGEIYSFHGNPASKRKSDTVQLAEMIEKRGVGAVSELDGIFAAIIFDIERNKVFVARDYFGIKPLYYSHVQPKNSARKGIYFCSEVKGLAGFPELTEIHEVAPGEILGFDIDTQSLVDRIERKPLAKLSFRDDRERVAALASALEVAVREQTADQDEYALLLSGGVDSSGLLALAQKSDIQLRAFVVGRKDSADVQAAREVAGLLGVELTEVTAPPEKTLFDRLQEIVKSVESFEPNVVRQSTVSDVLCREVAARGLRVGLCGEGADELFCGYPEFSVSDNPMLLRQRFLNDLRRTQLQRVDRTSMAQTIEMRVPFLSRRVAEVALSIDEYSSYFQENEKVQNKMIFREAIDSKTSLPLTTVMRDKVVLSEGAGYLGNDPGVGLFSSFAEQAVSDSEFWSAKRDYADYALKTKLEVFLFKQFKVFGYTKLISSKQRIVANSVNSLTDDVASIAV